MWYSCIFCWFERVKSIEFSFVDLKDLVHWDFQGIQNFFFISNYTQFERLNHFSKKFKKKKNLRHKNNSYFSKGFEWLWNHYISHASWVEIVTPCPLCMFQHLRYHVRGVPWKVYDTIQVSEITRKVITFGKFKWTSPMCTKHQPTYGRSQNCVIHVFFVDFKE